MNLKKASVLQRENFFKEFKETNPSLVLGLIVISLGLYIINWIFVRNKDFETLDEDAPDSKRGAIIMMIIPFSWFFIIYVLKYVIFKHPPLIIEIMEIVGWGIIIFLLLKYIFDFCHSFSKLTRTSHLFWFGFFLLGFIGIISTFLFKFYYLSPLTFFLIITIPAMQAELNSVFKSHAMTKKRDTYYG